MLIERIKRWFAVVFESILVARHSTEIGTADDQRRRILAATAMLADSIVVGDGESLTVGEALFRWLHAFKRLRTRYERRADIHQALLSLACSVICLRNLILN